MEETLLAEKFGARYEQYCKSVPRWIPRLKAYEENEITFEGGCGDSFERAVVIKGAPTHLDGVRAEYRYFAENFGPGGWTIAGQALCTHLGRQYDKMDIKLSDGTQKVVFFEITEFFGKR